MVRIKVSFGIEKNDSVECAWGALDSVSGLNKKYMMILTDKHRKLIEFAHAKCLEIPRRKKHCSIIIHKNRIISFGVNRFKTHPLAVKHGYLFGEVHSELDAFLKCDRKEGLELWNFRFNTLGQMGMSRPCPKCLPWCLNVFDRIVYTMDGSLHEFDIESFSSLRKM